MSQSATRVLLVEDDPGDAYILRHMLRVEGGDEFELEHVRRLADGFERLAAGKTEILLLDLDLPDSFGLDTFHNVHMHYPDIPVLVLSGHEDEAIALKAVREGAEDYLFKGKVGGQLLVRAIRYAIERHQLKEALRSLTLEDDLTKLYNRRGFMTLAEQQIKLALRQQRKLLLIFIDMDGLKVINDSFGHDAGSQALIGTADVLRATFRDCDIMARMGGDEFVVLLVESDEQTFIETAARLDEHLTRHNETAGVDYEIAISFGAAAFDPAAPCSLEDLIKQADTAMYEEKRRKRPSRQARVVSDEESTS